MNPLEIQEEGYIIVRLVGPDGQHVEMPVDLFAANNRLVEIRDAHSGESDSTGATKFNEDVVAYLHELGFPQCSHFAAYRFAQGIFQRKGELEKKVLSPDSASPT